MYLRTLQIQFSIKPKIFRGKYMNNFSVFYGNFQGIQTFLLFYTDFTDIVQLSFIMLSFLLYLNIQFHKIFEPIVFYISLALGYVLIGPSSNLLLKCQKLRQDPLRPSKIKTLSRFILDHSITAQLV